MEYYSSTGTSTVLVMPKHKCEVKRCVLERPSIPRTSPSPLPNAQAPLAWHKYRKVKTCDDIT